MLSTHPIIFRWHPHQSLKAGCQETQQAALIPIFISSYIDMQKMFNFTKITQLMIKLNMVYFPFSIPLTKISPKSLSWLRFGLCLSQVTREHTFPEAANWICTTNSFKLSSSISYLSNSCWTLRNVGFFCLIGYHLYLYVVMDHEI